MIKPTRGEARQAVTEAAAQASGVARTDLSLSRILLAMGLGDLVIGVLVAFAPSRGIGLAVLLILGALLVGGLVLLWRMRAFSHSGPRDFALAAAAFTWWNAAVAGASQVSGWWAPSQPTYHFTVSTVVAAVPLLVAAYLIGRRR